MKKLVLNLSLALSLCIISCKNEKATNNTSEAIANSKEEGTKFNADIQNSAVYWTGFKPTGQHTGTIQLKEGWLSIKDSKVVSGEFILDMNTITVTDLKPDEGKEDLEIHLKGTGDKADQDHFFNIKKYPTGKFTIAKVEEQNGKAIVYGNLSLKNVVKAVNFPANIIINDSLVSLESDSLMINRTYWKINYASKSIFHDLKDKFINDEVQVKLKVTTKK